MRETGASHEQPRILTDEPTVTVYDGRELVGIIIDRREGCEAGDASRRYLGKFRNWRDASTAIHEAREAEHSTAPESAP